jgi:hypothetical protein
MTLVSRGAGSGLGVLVTKLSGPGGGTGLGSGCGFLLGGGLGFLLMEYLAF